MCVSMLDSHGACISSVNVCFHAGLPRSFYISNVNVFPCWTPTGLVYPLVWMSVSMLDSHGACISSVNVCFHARLPRSFYISSVNVFPCWTPDQEGTVVKTSWKTVGRAYRLFEKIGIELVIKCLPRWCVLHMVGKALPISVPAIEKEQSPHYVEVEDSSYEDCSLPLPWCRS